ncbi:glycosyltransferase [Butyrivibrio sp. M55]|uniref:glycosyltransferase n=1 Tax=Butyrivibrio sp. M55 TaxID=1855323 RepID=UPI0008EDBB6B|nr:glycosyltransferase [Butyrivibrio sp. M55]SFU65832.1 Glycosyltransferase, GT2 family [Butyrivibrio sp. M55]
MDKTDIVRSIDEALHGRDFERLFQIRKEYEKTEKNDADLAYFFLIHDMEKDITGNISDGIISAAGNFENAVRIIKKLKCFIIRSEWAEEFSVDDAGDYALSVGASANEILLLRSIWTRDSKAGNNTNDANIKSRICEGDDYTPETFAFIICSNDKDEFDEAKWWIDRLYVPEGCGVEVLEITDARSMCSGYNEGMEYAASLGAKYKIYMHHDVRIINQNLLYDLIDIFKDESIGMVGMVGPKEVPNDGIMWSDRQYGNIVEARISKILNYREDSITLEYPDRKSVDVSLVDGCFIATSKDVLWREDIFDGFDFYDASQSMEFKKKGYRIIIPYMETPWIFHDFGMPELGRYDYYKDIFVKEYLQEKSLFEIESRLKKNSEDYELYYQLGNYYLKENPKLAFLSYENAYYMACKKYGAGSNEAYSMKDVLCKSKMSGKANARNVSFVILSYNSLEYTRECVESVRANCYDGAVEIVVVDNNSDDGSVKWLEEQEDIVFVRNKENTGFPRGCNIGIKAANPDNDIFLLNSDALMLPNSLYMMRMALYSDKKIGACGASTNNASNNQVVNIPLNTVPEYTEYARVTNIPAENIVELKSKLVMFAMLIKRDAYIKVGELDERYTPGNYEDDDYGMRLMEAGFRSVMCWNAFVYHYGSKSFGKMSDKYRELLERNRIKFIDKWGFTSERSMHFKGKLLAEIKKESGEKFSVLEVQCGFGEMLSRIKLLYPFAEVKGIESDEKIAALGKNKFDIEHMDLLKEDFSPDKKYDYVILDTSVIDGKDEEVWRKKLSLYVKDTGKLLIG